MHIIQLHQQKKKKKPVLSVKRMKKTKEEENSQFIFGEKKSWISSNATIKTNTQFM